MINRGYSYSRWDGSQQVFDVGADELMERLSDDLMADGDVMKALRELFRRGLQGPMDQRMPGLQDLVQRLKDQRQQRLERYNLDSVMDDLKQRLEEVLETERQGIDRRLQEARRKVDDEEGPERVQGEELYKLLEERAQAHREKLDDLPQSTGGAIKELLEYDFMVPEAQEKFQELMDMLKQRMAANMLQGMKEGLQGMTPEQTGALKEMLGQLNRMLREKLMALEPNFQEFMEQFGPMFGPNPPQSLEELMERLQQQMAQMESLLNSMSPEARQELEDALSSALDPETQRAMAELAALMGRMMPLEDMAREYPFLGDDSLTLDQAMELMGNLQDMDRLEDSLRKALRSGDLDQVDPESLTELLGEDARRTWEQLQELQRVLEEAGYITGGESPELTPRGIRKIGQRALKEVFSKLQKDRVGSHQMFQRGASGDALEETKTYEFGDPFQVHIQQSIKNAVLRGGPQVPVRMEPGDFEIYRNEHTTRAATVVLLDQSRSMGMFDAFQSAKKVAMALFSLIHTQYPRDSLFIIGFSDYAYEIKEDELPKLTWNTWSPGTNLHHALMLSRKLLSKEKGGTRQILLITDGEPTAHLEGEYSYFNYPPAYKTVMETLKEVRRCTQAGIIINTFMLENSYQLINFVDQITRINKGRTFYTAPQSLGQYLLVDYASNRKKRMG